MKSINLTGLALAVVLATSFAQAGDDKANTIIDHNLSKRPYHEHQKSSNEKSNEADAKKADNWDGATLVKDGQAKDGQEATGETKTGPNKYQQLRIRMLGQRTYMEKSPE